MSNPKVGRDTGEHIIRLYAHWQELRVGKQENERGIPNKVENSTDSKPQIIQGSQISTVGMLLTGFASQQCSLSCIFKAGGFCVKSLTTFSTALNS
jgi:hypothetical protein